MNNRFTQKAQQVLRQAKRAAEQMGHTYVGTEHLLLGLLREQDSAAYRFLAAKGVTESRVREAVARMDGVGAPSGSMPEMTPRVKHVLESARTEAAKTPSGYIGSEHLLLAILTEEDAMAARVLQGLGCSLPEMASELTVSLEPPPLRKAAPQEKSNPLVSYSRDLTALARAGKLDPVIGREKETDRMIRILTRKQKNNPCLIGDPGVGKTAVVEGLAQRIVRGEVPDLLQGRSILALDLSSMIAGAKYRGEFEERLRSVMNQIARHPELLLFIDEIHTIVGAGAAEGAMDAANILKPVLSRGEVRVIGATTLEEYRRYIEKDHALERRFQSIFVEEPDDTQTLAILHGLRDRLEAHHQLQIGEEALQAAVRLTRRYLPDKRMPDKAIDVLDEAAAALRLRERTPPAALRTAEEEWRKAATNKEEAIRAQDFERAARLRDEEAKMQARYLSLRDTFEQKSGEGVLHLSAGDVAAIVTEMTGIPTERMTQGETEGLRQLESALNTEVFGQKEAAEALARAITRGRLGLHDANRPMGVFLFYGPTGVGKTEMAKALARQLFSSPDALIRLDMSEYMEKHSVSRLIGSPPGYVGFEEGGILTEALRRRPYSVVLFDEMEKAHPDISGLLLQITEEGSLTDAQGRRADFRHAVVILTTNVGSAAPHKTTGFTAVRQEAEREDREEQLRQFFRPELLGRMDAILPFRPLEKEDFRHIAAHFLQECLRRAAERGYSVTAEESVVSAAAAAADARGGARSVRQFISRTVEDGLAGAILSGKVKKGEPVLCRMEGDALVFSPVQIPAPVG